MIHRPEPQAALTREHVLQLCGEVPDWKITRILASDATYCDLEAAVAWAAGESDVMGEARHPLSGRTAYLYEIITADEDIWDEGHGG